MNEPGLWLPSPDMDRWAYVARFSAYQGDATVSLTFFDETASRRRRSRHIFIPVKEQYPEDVSDVRDALRDVISDWGAIIGGECSRRREA